MLCRERVTEHARACSHLFHPVQNQWTEPAVTAAAHGYMCQAWYCWKGLFEMLLMVCSKKIVVQCSVVNAP